MHIPVLLLVFELTYCQGTNTPNFLLGNRRWECGEEFSLVEYFLGSSKPFLSIRHGKKALGSL